MVFAFPTPEDDFERELLSSIQTHGWSVLKVPADEEGPGFAFTLGLWGNYGHPEVIMVGLDLDLMHQILNLIGDAVKAEQQRFEDGQHYAELLEDLHCAFVEVAANHFMEYLGTALWLYGQQPFEALQCVWPDREGLYPWQDGFNPEWRELQPLLSTP
ncbi:hypothetical protein L1280_001232 [Deinococcus sp. HSC-46F16]|uniref:DUF4262 domain-containing protein n=1 Tax=Deinococcus sp. HSC-46F16 TaxID=2910968 RepID=UPI0020A1A15F|nr:DUF4262 domain-containing protein [Deinococcus sp. HSC-46F16]MCP2014095.1 hypothetical protein [Deinococcus sp. HSC-46F16]